MAIFVMFVFVKGGRPSLAMTPYVNAATRSV